MKRIKVVNPVVEMLGDEMAAVMWGLIDTQLIEPFLELDRRVYDLSIGNRDATDDAVTLAAAEAIRQHGVGVKCATITPDADRVVEFRLKKMWRSPNGTIRNALGGTIFRAPIRAGNIPLLVPAWKAPIVVARHGYGDQYAATEMAISASGFLKLVFEPFEGEPQELEVHKFVGPGVAMAMHNLDDSIEEFARAVLRYGLEHKLPVCFAAKHTILKVYHGQFRDIFARVFQKEFAAAFAQAGLTYTYKLIDDMVAWLLESDGGFLWACMNYDGDVMSDLVAKGFGSLGMMTSVLVAPDGRTREYEAAHGTVTRHFRAHQRGEPTSTNPLASIFAWTGALSHRGELDDTPKVVQFARTLERVCVEAVEAEAMTRDLARCVHKTPNPPAGTWMATEQFIQALAIRLRAALSG